jgi:hypothetical protein
MGLSVTINRDCDWCEARDSFGTSDPNVVILPEEWLKDGYKLYCPDCAPSVKAGELPPLDPEAQELLGKLQAVAEGEFLPRSQYEWNYRSHLLFRQLEQYGHKTRLVVDDHYYEERGMVVFLGDPPDTSHQILGWQLSDESSYIRADDLPTSRMWYVWLYPEAAQDWLKYEFASEHEARKHADDLRWLQSRAGESTRWSSLVSPEGEKPKRKPDFTANL